MQRAYYNNVNEDSEDPYTAVEFLLELADNELPTAVAVN